MLITLLRKLSRRRKSERTFAYFRVTARLAGQPAEFTVGDVSQIGFSLACSAAEFDQLQTTKAPLLATLLYQGFSLGCLVSIANCRAASKDAYRVGFRIEQIAPDDLLLLQSITAKLQALPAA